MTTDERSLATWLATRDDAALAETFALRAVSPSVTWSDFFDAADALLDAASVDRAITRLPRPALAALAGGDSDAARAVLERLALIDAAGEPYTVVADRVAAVRATAPEALTAGSAPADPPPRRCGGIRCGRRARLRRDRGPRRSADRHPAHAPRRAPARGR